MTYAQIGGQPHKPCCHVDNRASCHICANFPAIVAPKSVPNAVRTDVAS